MTFIAAEENCVDYIFLCVCDFGADRGKFMGMEPQSSRQASDGLKGINLI